MRVVGTAVIARVHLLKFIFSIDLSNFYSYNHVIMYTRYVHKVRVQVLFRSYKCLISILLCILL